MKAKESILKKNEISVTPETLAEWLREEKDVFIFDIRPTEQRREWSIPESAHADIYRDIKSGKEDPFQSLDLPRNRPIVAVCGAGKTSLTAAEKLRTQGIQAYSLEGGMKAWNFAWSAAETSFDEDLTVVQVRRLAKGCLSYLVGSGDEAVVIDASLDPQVYINLAEERGWTIKHVMDTHLHADYVSRTRGLAEATGADHLLFREAGVDFPFTPIDDGEEIYFGDTSITALHTPGHTPESLSYLIRDKAVFTGDTLFTDGVGRPDLKANQRQALRKAEHLYESIQNLLSLDINTLVFPAHTSSSVRFSDPIITATIGELTDRLELISLPKKEFVKKAVSRIPATPANYLTISGINKGVRIKDISWKN